MARGWWKERQRALNAVRHALATHDLSARHDAEWHAARQDPLTGVGNRRALDERLTAARDSGRAVTLLAIDVDDLKVVNDTYGHACGDELLQVVANLLVEQARATDAVIRSGGDEFFVVLDQPDAKGGAQLAERIRTAVAAIAAATDQAVAAAARTEHRVRRDGGRCRRGSAGRHGGPAVVRRQAPQG